ncbi:alanine/glycine:cation symporter family protein [Persicirhabdus sediminis]|uniref:Alanine:cation symporter family protein n=1 Tax=Persicirhabdus sediminis TaxID=454144 RepID=A0A8J7MHB3_9BACT|nr:alanine/glycine:cation symporter family protein [Persicirhabdus sediminis]MBK1791884.1 alanine:cation symporter family protein [Persicirhabdus sediminis]
MNAIASLRRLFAYLMIFPMMIGVATAGEEQPVGFADKLDAHLSTFVTYLYDVVFVKVPIWGEHKVPVVLIFLVVTGVFMTIYFKFLNVRAFGLAIRTARGKYTPKDAPGQITHFQALTAALSATVGLGNISGVAIAVGIGGPGATFWMIMMALCGMTTKFCECTLGVKYRKIDAQGKVHGGGMYYLSQGLKERGLGKLGAVLAVFFAIMCIGSAIGAGNMYQVNQATTQMSQEFGLFIEDIHFLGMDLPGSLVFGTIIAVIAGSVIIGGIVWIARVTSILVPLMCGAYVIGALIIIFGNLEMVPGAFKSILVGAFSSAALGGGFIGALIQGVTRGAFSNEAGFGSAPIAHSAVKTKKPASEGLVALIEPFTDTVVVCTMTALVLVITGAWNVDALTNKDEVALFKGPEAKVMVIDDLEQGSELSFVKAKVNADGNYSEVYKDSNPEETYWVANADIDVVEGIRRTSYAFQQELPWFPGLLGVAVLLFAFSTMISWSYYGEQAVIYLCGRRIPGVVLAYKLMFCVFSVIGAVASLTNVLAISDAMFFAMMVPNVFALFILLPVVKRELKDFQQHAADIDSGAKSVEDD